MSAAGSSAAAMLTQLESARKLALGDAQVYEQIIPGILPIISPAAPLEVRRWGADFLAEGFASPLLQQSVKEKLTQDVLPTLKIMLDNPNEDLTVVRSAIQACASIYPLVFRRIITQPDQAQLWHDMTAIKSEILKRMDTSPSAVRICCVKFVQKVVHVQTPGMIADPRRPEQNETSIALVPRNHPLLPLPNIEAETSGLLDRLLSVLQEQSGDPIMIDATVNCLPVLIRTRPAVQNKILSTVLNYNPFRSAVPPLDARQMVIMKSLERTIRALLKHVFRILPNSAMEGKIQAYIARLQQVRTALFSESQSLKRPAEHMNGVEDAKRPRLSTQPIKFPPMPPPPNTFGQLFTLTEDSVLQQFDVKLLQADMVSDVVGLLLPHIDAKILAEAVEAIRQRYTVLQKAAQPPPMPGVPLQGPTGIDDEDDYDPELLGASDAVVSPATEKALEELAQPIIELGPFELPKPPPLSVNEVAMLSDQTVSRVFDMAAGFEHKPASVRPKSGLNRLAASANDKEAWITILARLATRAPAGLEDYVDFQTNSYEESKKSRLKFESAIDGADTERPDMANRIRQTLYHYIVDDWRSRLNIAISWLTEEWYNDKMARRAEVGTFEAKSLSDMNPLPNYTRSLNRLLTYVLPRFDASDSKLLIRFLSELPHLSGDILGQIKQLTRDPGTVKMCILALQYLVMFRLPVRDLVLDCFQDIWLEGDEGIRRDVGKVLGKWRPGYEADLEARADGKLKQEAVEMQTDAD